MKVIVLSGPTASGKTSLSIDLAKKFGGEVVNFDSLLLYKEITIGTAKPTLEERQSVPHHMIDVRSISSPMNAADYARESLQVIQEILSRKEIVYLVGGSGFYLQAILKGMYDSPTSPPEVLKKSDELYKKEGIAPFRKILSLYDSESFNRYHENDHYRIRRAVEHWWSHSTPLSKERSKKDESNEKLIATNIHGWDLLHIFLDLPKEEHVKIIERRTDKMLSDGLYQEVLDLLEQGFTGKEKPLQSIGYKEILDLHQGNLESLEECRERIVISTRQLAKSQRTWFNRDNLKFKFHPLDQRELIFEKVDEFLKTKDQE